MINQELWTLGLVAKIVLPPRESNGLRNSVVPRIELLMLENDDPNTILTADTTQLFESGKDAVNRFFNTLVISDNSVNGVKSDILNKDKTLQELLKTKSVFVRIQKEEARKETSTSLSPVLYMKIPQGWIAGDASLNKFQNVRTKAWNYINDRCRSQLQSNLKCYQLYHQLYIITSMIGFDLNGRKRRIVQLRQFRNILCTLS